MGLNGRPVVARLGGTCISIGRRKAHNHAASQSIHKVVHD